LFQIQSQSASGKGSVKCMTVNFFLSRVSSQACGGAFCYREQLTVMHLTEPLPLADWLWIWNK
jgi:hypothetical protein